MKIKCLTNIDDYKKGNIYEVEENKRIMQQYIDGFLNNRDYSEANEILHKDYSGSAGGGITGVDGIKQYISYMSTIVSDGHWETLEMLAEGDKVSVFQKYTGTFDGEFQGIYGQDQPLSFLIAGVYEFRDGKVYRGLSTAVTEWLDCYQQMGVLPPTEEIIQTYKESL